MCSRWCAVFLRVCMCFHALQLLDGVLRRGADRVHQGALPARAEPRMPWVCLRSHLPGLPSCLLTAENLRPCSVSSAGTAAIRPDPAMVPGGPCQAQPQGGSWEAHAKGCPLLQGPEVLGRLEPCQASFFLLLPSLSRRLRLSLAGQAGALGQLPGAEA